MGGRGSKGKSGAGGNSSGSQSKYLQSTLDNAKNDPQRVYALEQMPVGTTIDMGFKTPDEGNIQYQKVGTHKYKEVGGSTSDRYISEYIIVRMAKKHKTKMKVVYNG